MPPNFNMGQWLESWEMELVDTTYPSQGVRRSQFECRDSGVTRRLAAVLQQAETNSRGGHDFPASSSSYLANIHYPVFRPIPQSVYVNETASVGSPVFQDVDIDAVAAARAGEPVLSLRWLGTFRKGVLYP